MQISVEQSCEEHDEEELDRREDPHILAPMLVVVSDEKRPRMHEKGSEIARAAKPLCATSNCSRKQKYARMLMTTRIGVPCHSLTPNEEHKHVK